MGRWRSGCETGRTQLLLTSVVHPAHPVVVEYWTIEVLDGELSALRWRDAYGDALVETAHTNLIRGASPWNSASPKSTTVRGSGHCPSSGQHWTPCLTESRAS